MIGKIPFQKKGVGAIAKLINEKRVSFIDEQGEKLPLVDVIQLMEIPTELLSKDLVLPESYISVEELAEEISPEPNGHHDVAASDVEALEKEIEKLKEENGKLKKAKEELIDTYQRMEKGNEGFY